MLCRFNVKNAIFQKFGFSKYDIFYLWTKSVNFWSAYVNWCVEFESSADFVPFGGQKVIFSRFFKASRIFKIWSINDFQWIIFFVGRFEKLKSKYVRKVIFVIPNSDESKTIINITEILDQKSNFELESSNLVRTCFLTCWFLFWLYFGPTRFRKSKNGLTEARTLHKLRKSSVQSSLTFWLLFALWSLGSPFGSPRVDRSPNTINK